MTETIDISGALSPHQTAIWNKLCDGEAGVVALFAETAKLDAAYRFSYPSHREMQQRIGSKITHINRKVAEAGYKIVPGEQRRTYRIIKI